MIFSMQVLTANASANIAKGVTTTAQAFTTGLNGYFVGLFYTVLPIVAYWFLFEKKGQAGWKAIIPFYGSYIKFKLFFNTKKFWMQFIACILLFIAFLLIMIGGVIGDSAPDQAGITALIGLLLLIISLIWLIVIEIQYDISICKKYGRGFWFILGMIFFTPIFTGILAYEVYKGRAKEV